MKEKISTNHYKGEPIKTIEEIYNLSKQKKGIYVSSWKKIIPAAFLIFWQASALIGFIKMGCLFTTVPIPKKAEKKMWYQHKKV